MIWLAIPGCLKGVGMTLTAEMSTHSHPSASWGGAASMCLPFGLTQVQSYNFPCFASHSFLSPLATACLIGAGIGSKQSDLVRV